MLRATVWTVGLFGAGTAISRAFPGTWTEPLVLFALGLALLFVSTRTAQPARAAAPARTVAAMDAMPAVAANPSPSPARVVAATAAAPARSVQVEGTA